MSRTTARKSRGAGGGRVPARRRRNYFAAVDDVAFCEERFFELGGPERAAKQKFQVHGEALGFLFLNRRPLDAALARLLYCGPVPFDLVVRCGTAC